MSDARSTVSATTYPAGELIMRREVLHGRPWMEHPVRVVEDDGDELAVLLQPGSRFTFHDHPHGPHPWRRHRAWQGPEVLQVHRPGLPYSVWKFFDDGVLRYWYVNFETPIVRQGLGFDTGDHGLDLIVQPDGTAEWKDVDHLSTMRSTGRMTDREVLAVLEAATEVSDLLRAGRCWWRRWDDWVPPRSSGAEPSS